MEPPGENFAATVVTFDSPDKLVLRWDSTVSEDARDKMIFEGDRHEIDRYLQAVDEIQKSMELTTVSESSSSSSVLQIAMARLEDEFRNILLSHPNPVETEYLIDPTNSSIHSAGTSRTNSIEFNFKSNEEELKEVSSGNIVIEGNVVKLLEHRERSNITGSSMYKSTSSIREIDLIPSDAIYDLRCIADRMIAAGYLRECIQVYGSVRKSAVDANFKKLRIEKLSIGDIQRLEWEVLEAKIWRCIRAAKICVRELFASEKRLCEQIFEDMGTSTDDACFMETIKGPTIHLFNFADAISIGRRTPEKLFKILDLHDALMDLMPDIEVVFESKSSESIRVQAVEIVSRLAEAARGILSEFENAVLREPSRVPVPGGTIHPLTRYVMNYISLISDYKHTLMELESYEIALDRY